MSEKTKTDIHKKEEQDRTIMAKKTMIDALEKSLAVVTGACRSTGLSRSQHYKWMEDDPEYKEAVEDIREIAVDFAESQLHKQIKDGSTAATIFYLKTKGKSRGYIERVEMDGLGASLIQVEVVKPGETEED